MTAPDTPEDELDARLDDLISGAPMSGHWVEPIHRHLVALDSAAAGPEGTAFTPALAGATGPPATELLPGPSSPPESFPDQRTITASRSWLAAAAVVVLLLGAIAAAVPRGDEAPRRGVTIFAATAPIEPTADLPASVALTDCTLPELTQEHILAALPATPISDDERRREIGRHHEEIMAAVAPRVIDGTVRLTGGTDLPPLVQTEIAEVLGGYFGCAFAGQPLRAASLLSDWNLGLIEDVNGFLADARLMSGTPAPSLDPITMTQGRELADGRVAVVVQLREPGYEEGLLATVVAGEGQVALQGTLLVFAQSATGWRLDYAVDGTGLTLDLLTRATPAATAGAIELSLDTGTLPPFDRAAFAARLATLDVPDS